ncbi:MAG TPA: hypothetical protein VH583_22970 [Vicinamibacterales bacterium]|jgi:hypothetical protein
MSQPFDQRSIVERAARVAFAFVLMNAEVVAGLVAFVRGKKVWRES